MALLDNRQLSGNLLCFPSFKILYYVHLFMEGHKGTTEHFGGRRSTLGSWFFPFTVWVLGMELTL